MLIASARMSVRSRRKRRCRAHNVGRRLSWAKWPHRVSGVPDGSFTYTPNAGYSGSDSFQYAASDGATTSTPATVTISFINTGAPVANAVSYSVECNNTFSADASTGVLANATDADGDTLTANLVTGPSNGTLTLNSDGSFDYTPNANYTGNDSFTYAITDGGLTSTPATVSISVKPSDTPPTATALSYSVSQNTSFSTDSSSGVLTGASDSDGDPLYATLVSGPSNGTLQFNLDGSFTYTPNTNFYGTDSFQYEAFDGTTYSSPATVTLNVAQDVPTVANASYSVLPTGTTSETASNGVLATANDPNGATLTAVLVTPPSYGSLTLNTDGSFNYTPNSSFTGSDSFTYEAYNGLAYSSPATVSLTSAPVAVAQTYSVNHDTPLTVDNTTGLLTGASDADGDALTAALATPPNNGTVSVGSDGSFTYTPNTHFVGSDSFTYTVTELYPHLRNCLTSHQLRFVNF